MTALLSKAHLSIGRLLLIAVASLPFLASLGFCSIDARPARCAILIERPALVFDQYLVNLGEIHNTAKVEAHFRFKNCGSFPLRITNVTPSCKCLAPQIEKRVYAPGEISDFTLGVLTTHQTPGPHEYLLTLDYEDPQPHAVTVTFKLVIRREVTLSPSQLIVYQNGVSGDRTKGGPDRHAAQAVPSRVGDLPVAPGASRAEEAGRRSGRGSRDDGRDSRGGSGASCWRRLLRVSHDRRSALSEDSRAAENPGRPRKGEPDCRRGSASRRDCPGHPLMPADDPATTDRDRIALAIQQPWAELILRGIKTLEVRSQPTQLAAPSISTRANAPRLCRRRQLRHAAGTSTSRRCRGARSSAWLT